ncbi:hypothetical protein [Dactylosporangium sp. CA-139066]|uniref:hypothetical protein n=1 Tax=Dactylosporangium sp. CA-139066 TaxID=3239930 RepID=UPI003D937BA8
MALAAVVCVAGALCLLGLQLRDRNERMDRNHQRAEAELPIIARGYADDVVGAAHDRSGPDDDSLRELAARPRAAGTWVWVITRTPDLTLVVETNSTSYTLLEGQSSACFRLAFHDLGGAAAGYDLEKLEECPPGLPLQFTSASPSAT